MSCCWVALTFVSLVCGSVMFSSGNVTEKARVAAFPAKDDVVVDMFAGIGYFTVPLLVSLSGSRAAAIKRQPPCSAGERFRSLLRARFIDAPVCYVSVVNL